jgi:hypothetical protein
MEIWKRVAKSSIICRFTANLGGNGVTDKDFNLGGTQILLTVLMNSLYTLSGSYRANFLIALR